MQVDRKFQKELNKIQKTNKHTTSLFDKGWFKCVLGFVVYLIFFFLAETYSDSLEKTIEGNENWAIALIAFPIALFGIYISILFPFLNKMNIVVLDTPTRDIEKSALRTFDYRVNVWCYTALNTVFWVHDFIVKNYSKMIVLALYLCVGLIYLILYTVWIYSLDPLKTYCENIVGVKIKETNIYKNIQSTSQKISTNLNEVQLEEINKYINKTYTQTLDTINYLFLQMLLETNGKQAEQVFLYTLDEIKKFELSELNITIVCQISRKCAALCDELVKRKKFYFLYQTTFRIFLICWNYVEKLCKSIQAYLDIIEKYVKIDMSVEQVFKIARESLPFLYKYKYYKIICTNINNNLVTIVQKISNEENYLNLLNDYNINKIDFKNIDNLLENYDRLINKSILVFEATNNVAEELAKSQTT